jgi:rSAM/selenodomain-associated transferase 1
MNQPNSRSVIVLFVRVPLQGRVKTRLVKGLGADGACLLYQAMVADILSNIKACAFPLYLFHDGTEASALPAAWVAAAAKVIAQQGAGIGARMAAAFEYCFAENIEEVILVGSDIPGLDADVLVKASAALASHDAAMVPVIDGGYCLIALQRERYRARIFEGIPWSTNQVLRVTLQRFKECTMSVHLQSALFDIDTMVDVQRYCQKPLAQALAINQVLAHLGKRSEMFRL